MTVISSSKLESSLMKKGFKREPGDHRFYFLYDDSGKRTSIRTKLSHNGQDINDYLISCMKRQLHLSKSQFLDLVNCPLSYEQYINILRKNNVLR